MKEALWYFDIISPYAYLQSKQLDKLDQVLSITPVPVLFAGLLNHWGQLGPAEIEPKRQFIFRQCAWRAAREGIPFTMPPTHPFNPLWGLRLIIETGNSPAAIQSVFEHIWAKGRGLELEEDKGQLANALGLTLDQANAAVQQADVKQVLIDNTQQAVQSGIFGVPSFAVDGQNFWGADSSEMLSDWLAGDLDFGSEIMRQIDSTEASSNRPRR